MDTFRNLQRDIWMKSGKTPNNRQQWATMGNNVHKWATMGTKRQQSAVLHASLMPFL